MRMQKLAEEGMTMMCVTHEMGFAREVADRIMLMYQGKVVAQAAPEELIREANPRLKACLKLLGRLSR